MATVGSGPNTVADLLASGALIFDTETTGFGARAGSAGGQFQPEPLPIPAQYMAINLDARPPKPRAKSFYFRELSPFRASKQS